MNTGNEQSNYQLCRLYCALRLAALVVLQALIDALTAWRVRDSTWSINLHNVVTVTEAVLAKSWRVIRVVHWCVLRLTEDSFFDLRLIADFLLFTVINYILICIVKFLPKCHHREANRHKEIINLLIFFMIIYLYPFIITQSIYRHFKVSHSSCGREQLFPSTVMRTMGHSTFIHRPF